MASKRAALMRPLLKDMDRLVTLGPIPWDEAAPDVLSLAINHVLRRQRDAIEAAVVLADAGLGHLAVGFVRPALDERLWLAYLNSLEKGIANTLLLAMGRYDTIRSLTAQNDVLGEDAMLGLWYPQGFVEAKASLLPRLETELKKFGKTLGWGRRAGPTAAWLAEQVGEAEEYAYLHSATSRALHFSMGEVMRRGWGTPGDLVITDKEEFREHLTEFALDQLWRLWFFTVLSVSRHLETAGVTSIEGFDVGPEEIVGPLLALGKVPLVHAAEWNLTPNGPLPLDH